MMKFKGYIADVIYDDEAKLFHGEVLGLKDVITFQGTSVKDLEKAFHDSVDDYLDWCKERGEKPEKAFSGSLCVRMSPDLHAKLAREAMLKNKSLNNLIIDKLSR